jgi:membrane associated rhomboid family serine protease
MAGSNAKLSTLGTIALIVPLLAILAAAGWFAVSAFVSLGGPPMPLIGYVAMVGGVIVSLAVGCGLMALLFYSNRHGYDETFAPRDDDSDE